MRGEKPLELPITHVDGVGVLVEEFDLLHHSPPNDLVIAVQSQCEPLAEEDLATHVLVDEVLKLRLGRRNTVLLLICPCDVRSLCRARIDAIPARLAIQGARGGKYQRTQDQE